jgi:hypothetical protein
MQKMMTRRAAHGLAALCLALSLAGCTREWFLQIDLAGGEVAFCVTQRAGCSGAGVPFPSIAIDEVDRGGAALARAWTIRPVPAAGTDYTTIRQFRYGRAPAGWKEDAPARPLRPGVFYAFDSNFYFYLDQGKVVVLHRAEFFAMVQKGTLPRL